ELYERVLYNIIDSIDGYATFTQESLQDNINRIEEKIEEMEERLDKKTEMMINRFVQLELTLSQIQNQSNWLTGQINAAAGAWR
ncbi:MAG: hypothetical protein JRI77_15485, partial [Deltaproteobacteria bacterium]|nr:hypothetical protein [Deltaproteobacteria bacterium]